MSYTPYGPWTNDSDPPINQDFLNDLETFLQTINSAATSADISAAAGVLTALGLIANGPIQPNATGTVTNLNTAGTVTLWQPFRGTFKLALLFFSGARNAGANQDIALPTAFTRGAFIYIGDFVNPRATAGTGINLLSATVAQNMILYLGSNAAPSSGTSARALNIGACQTGFDTVRVLGNAGWTGTASDWVMLAGV